MGRHGSQAIQRAAQDHDHQTRRPAGTGEQHIGQRGACRQGAAILRGSGVYLS